VTRVSDALVGVRRLALDSAPVIYFVEAQPNYGPLMAEVFQRIGAGQLAGHTSVVTLTEVLVKPLLTADHGLIATYRDLLLNSDGIETSTVDRAAAEHAAELRARYNLRTPDARQLAVALRDGCQAFLTNDVRLKRVTELDVLVLDELEL
jgi:predicted nucleic acid-binding protein